MRLTVLVATANAHKVSEIRRILTPARLTVRSLADYPPQPAVKENGRTLAANAAKKAETAVCRLGIPALADDSGLFVPALNNQPGVRSARYAGPKCDYVANNRKLLRAMRALTGKKRQAYFATVVALANPGRKTLTRIGKIWGKIITEPQGENGFGYDPVFVPRGQTKTFAQMTLAQKNKISHRAIAFQKMTAVLERIRLEK